MDMAYLERTAEDLYGRISTVVLNDSQNVPVQSIVITGNQVTVTTEEVRGITKILSLKLHDETGSLITERETEIDVVDSQVLTFKFQFDVKRGDGVAV